MKPLVLLSLILMFSCKAQQPIGEPIEGLKLLAWDAYGPGAEFEASIIKDQKTLNQFYSLVNRTRKPGLTVPWIDFERELVLLIELGTRQGEREVLLSIIGETDSERTLAVEILQPSKDQGPEPTSQAILQPFFLYKMKGSDKSLVFERIEN